jgi:hypothetical protein
MKLVRAWFLIPMLWRGILGTALVIAAIYLILKLSQLADAYRAKIKAETK